MTSFLLGIQHLFPTILRMSLSAGILVLVVIVLRFVFRKTPKWMLCLLWVLVAVRLVCPILPESRVSLMPEERVQEAQIQSALDTGLPTVEFETIQDHAINQSRPEDHNVSVSTSASPSEYLPFVWAIGVLLMLLYALISFLRLKRRAAVTVQVSEGVLSCDEVQSPFILGIIRPKIYLPSGLEEPQLSYVLAHERAHLRRRDHWWKPLGYLLLAVHWFNPLCWLAYILLCRDIEMACDERVIRDMDREHIAAYSQTILDCGLPRKRITACPLAFGEVGVKTRVKGVLNYKKPAFWIVLVAVIVCAVVAVCFLTRPEPAKTPESAETNVTPTPEPLLPGVYEGIDMEHAKTYILDTEYNWTASLSSIPPFYIILDTENGLFQYYETPISSYIGLGKYELEGDILTIADDDSGHPRVNRFRMEDERLVWLEEGSDNFTFVKLTDGATFSLDKTLRTRRLTLEDVHALASRGEALTWEDLRHFEGEDVGSGLYIYRYPIDDTYCLEARGGSLEGAPMSVLLLHVDEAGGFLPSTGYSIDIRTDDIDAFLAAQANKEPFLTVTSGGQSVAAYPILLYERTWTEHGWLYADGVPAASEVLEHPERIPTLTLSDDFSVAFGGGAVRKSGLEVYDEQFNPLRESWYGDTALNWLDPGTYYCVIEVHGPLGNYIASEDAYEESAYRCIFRLTVSAKGSAPYTPQEAHDLTRATLRYRGGDYVLTDEDSLRQLEAWLSGATELIGGAGCPFGSLLTLTRSDGSEISLCPAEDSCGTVFAAGHYYRYGSGNEAFWALFGVTLNWTQ